jgi:hypothetical protein
MCQQVFLRCENDVIFVAIKDSGARLLAYE